MVVEETFSTVINSMTEGQLKEYIHTVGKAANQRLRELEKQGLQNSSAAYRYIQKIHKMEDYATSTTGAGQIKFNLRVRGRSFDELRHMVATIDDFMEAKSSTTGGVKDIYRQAAETFEKHYKGKFTKEDYSDFTEAMSYSLFRNFEKIYGSQLAIQYVEHAQGKLGLTWEEMESAIRSTGFTETTKEDKAPSYDAQITAANVFAANKKTMTPEDQVKNESGILDANFDI